MRALWLLFVWVWLLALPHPASGSSSVPTGLPNCAYQCFTTAIANSKCKDTNQTCLCSNQALQREAAGCITQSCTVKESLIATNLSTTGCGVPVRDNSWRAIIQTVILIIISTLFVIQRFSAKIFWRAPIWLDDWFILLSYLISIIYLFFIVCGMVRHGLGRDIWTLSPADIAAFGIYIYAGGLAYIAILLPLKLSLLFFYLRIFPTQPVRLILWGTILLNAVSGITFFIGFTIQCQPISYFWNQWDGEHRGHCANMNAMAWSHAALGIAIDIWMLIVPLSQLKSLNLGWKKKVGVGIMFSVGTFVTIISIIRLHSLIKVALNRPNLTQDLTSCIIWSFIEINVGIICACLPSLRILLTRLFPKFFGASHQSCSGQAEGDKAGKSGNRRGGLGSRTRTAIHATASQQRHDIEGIICQRAYAIDFGDNDETHLVSMTDLGQGSLRSNVSL